jgi:hypothetical protein
MSKEEDKGSLFASIGGCLVALGMFAFSLALGALPILLAIYIAKLLGWFN